MEYLTSHEGAVPENTVQDVINNFNRNVSNESERESEESNESHTSISEINFEMDTLVDNSIIEDCAPNDDAALLTAI